MKRFFEVTRLFSPEKLLHLFVLVSLVLTSCGSPLQKATEENATPLTEAASNPDVDEAPVFTQPEPVLGDRTQFENSENQEAGNSSNSANNNPNLTSEALPSIPTPTFGDGSDDDSISPFIISGTNEVIKGDGALVPSFDYSQFSKIQSDPEGANLSRMSVSATASVSDTLVAGGGNIQGYPAIEFNTASNETLAVWTDWSTSPASIWGRRLALNGTPIGEAFFITDGQIDYPISLSIVHNSIDGTYILLWAESNGGTNTQTFDGFTYSFEEYNLYLLPLSSAGEPTSSSATLVTDTLTKYGQDSSWYDIVYNPNDNEYLLVWREPPGGRRYTTGSFYYLSPHHVVGEKFNADGEAIGSPVTLAQYADTDVNIGYDSSSNTYILTFNRYGAFGGCSFLTGNCYYYNYLILYSQAFTSFLWATEWEYYNGEIVEPKIHYIGGADGHILSADLTYLPDENAFLSIFWNNAAYDPSLHGDIYARKIHANNGYPIDSAVKIFSGVGQERTPGEFNPLANQTFVLTGVDDVGGIDGLFLNSSLDSSGAYSFTNDTLDWNITAVENGTAPGWLAIWSTNSDIYVRSISPYTGPYTSIFGNSILNGPCIDACHPQTSASATVLGPINTNTGGLSYHSEDISISTSIGPLIFYRTYSSLAVDLYSTDVGYGWTHNLDTQLIFPNDPGGETGYVLFKEHTANLYQFYDLGNNTFSPAPGILGELTYANGQYALTLPNQSRYDFDTNGRVLAWQDETGHTWNYNYNGNDRIQSVSADNGTRALTLEYDSQGRIVSVTDQTGRSITYTYDINGNLVSATSLAGGTWQYEYDSAHRLTRVIDPNGNTDEQTEYDAQGRAIKQWDGEGNLLGTITYNEDGTTTITDPFDNIETHSYDSRLTLTESEDGGGGSTQKAYDQNFRPTSITDAANATTTLMWSADGANLTQVVDAEGGQTDITYDALNNPTSVIDPAGYLTTYAYDGTLLTGTTNALNQETTYTYTPEGFIESVTDPLGHTTSYTYDVYGQRTSMTDSIGNTWLYAYDSLGRLVDATDPLGRVSHSEYDAAGRLTRSVRNYDPNKTQNEDNLWNIVTEYEYDLGGNQTLVRDTYGRETEYQYDDADRLVKTIDPDGNETTSTYNEAGQLVSTTDALGHATTYAYDAVGRLISSTDALGNSTTTIYNLDGTVASTSDALGRVTSYTYDDLKRVLTVTQSNGAVTSNSYDDNGNLIASTDALGNTTQYEYDALGRVIKTTDPLGNFTETFYDSAGRMVQTKDARGNATTYAYDDAGRQMSVTDALGNVTSYEYDDLGRRTAVIDAAGNRTEYTYDDLDRVIAVTNPLGNTVYTEYDALGQVLTRTDANGNDVTFEYNNLGQTTSQTDALGNVTSFGYDEAGNRLNTTNARGAISSVTYDALNRPVVMIDPLGYSTSTNYDAAGQVSSSTNANGEITTFTYNSVGQQATVTDPLGNSTQYAYDSAGRMTSTIDGNGLATAFEYDALGRLTAVIENYKPGFEPTTEINVRTEYTYDENGNRLSITDGNGHVTTFTYDELNRLLTETDPLGNTWTYVYDVLGNRVSMTDAKGETTNYSFDDANRLDGIDYTDNSDVEFSYDAGGRRTSMTDSVGTTSWTYDDLNRPTAITDPFGTTVSYAYDPVGNLARMVYPNKDVGYTYDSANRLTLVNDTSKVTGYEYDPLGRVSTILRANGVNTTYTYDAASRLTQLQHGTAETELASYQYTYDDTGNRVQAVERVKTAGAGPTVRLTVVDTAGVLQTGKSVYAFSGETYTGTHAVTDANGQVAITLPQGDYRFRVDVDGTQFWSGTTNHCTIGQCDNLLVTIPTPVLAVVHDSDGTPQANVPVYAFIGTSYTGYHGTTNESGEVVLRLPEGNYSLRADFGGAQFWSTDLCFVAGCGIVPITVNLPVTVTVLDNISMPHAGIEVYAYDGTTYTGKHATTDENGQVQLALQNGNYRFRADFNGTQFWSGAENHCTVSTCREAGIAVTLPLMVTVTDSGGSPQQGISVYAFNDTTYTGFNGVTDLDGRVTFTLPAGNYRFRADLNGTQFWSDTQNHCTVPDCSGAQVTVTSSTTITVLDTDNAPKAGVNVYAFNGTTYLGYHGTTDANGQVSLTLPQGGYRFRADYNGTQFWSGTANHCDVPGCSNTSITVTNGVLVTVSDTDSAPKAGLKVYAYNGATYTGFNATTNAYGQVVFTLPQGSYRFRTDLNGTQFWSGASNHCDIPGCGNASITVTNPVTVTVRDTDGNAKSGLKVYAFNGATYTGYNATTNANGQVTLTLPLGSYRFRADLNPAGGTGGTQFWSGAANHCDVPGCASADVTVSIPFTVTVQIANGTPQTGIKVYAFNGTTYTGYNATTNASGQVILTLPLGSYRFRADFNGAQYWSGASNHCDVPGCLSLTMIIGPQPTATATVNATNSPTATMTETPLPATATLTPEATETASPTPEATVTETPQGSGYQSGLILASVPNSLIRTSRLLVAQPQPQSVPPNDVTVTVLDTDSISKEGLNVYVFDGATYTGFQGTTDSNGQITFTLPDGDYRFRADFNGTQFWSGEVNHCAVPGCDHVGITVTKPQVVSVFMNIFDEDDNIDYVYVAGVNVYAFIGDTYTGYHQVTNQDGEAEFTLPEGEYHFRADYTAPGAGNSVQFWSIPANGFCSGEGCPVAEIIVPNSLVSVTILDIDAVTKEGVNVYVFDETTYTGYHYTTDITGQAVFTLPFGSYRFRADLNGTQFWSGTANHCELNNGCNSASITVTKPMMVTIADELNAPYADLPVYAFDGTTYTGYHSTTNANGQVMFTLPEGNYRFRADLRGVQYWSAAENTCELPICESSAITIPGGFEYADVTIDYTYDPLYRLTAADYSTGDFYHYAYDSVGNRLTQENLINGLSSTFNYNYDIANRLTDAGSVSYVYDANGNLLNDGTNTYAYDFANRLVEVDNGNGGGAEYTYNGLGDRLTQTAPSAANSSFWETTNYTLDLNAGLTQVLYDGTTTYTYGLGRISQQSGNTPEYFLGDALGSVRQMADQAGAITYARNYDPYGVVSYTGGTSQTAYGFTGEQYGDSTQLLYLRARYYNPADGRFISKDPSRWENNLYLYAQGNPANRTDPTGLYSKEMIRKNINPIEFESDGFFDEKNHSRWGFYALLRNAQDFDYIQVGSLNLQTMYPSVSFSSGEALWSINCNTIMIGSQTLEEYYNNTVKKQKYHSVWWRDTSPMYYDLFSISTYPKSRRSFTDGLDFGEFSDIPQFRSFSRGFGIAEAQLIVDISGGFHLAFSGGFGESYGWSYLEGYLCNWDSLNLEGCLGNTPSPSDVSAVIDGLCWSNELIIIGGINVSPLCRGAGGDLTDPSTYSAVSTFSVGAAIGGGWGLSLTLPLSSFVPPHPSWGWKWALDNQTNGITFKDIVTLNGGMP